MRPDSSQVMITLKGGFHATTYQAPVELHTDLPAGGCRDLLLDSERRCAAAPPTTLLQ